MTDVTVEHILRLAGQLTDEEKETLIDKLQSRRPVKRPVKHQLPTIDLGPWPDNLTLRRNYHCNHDR